MQKKRTVRHKPVGSQPNTCELNNKNKRFDQNINGLISMVFTIKIH